MGNLVSFVWYDQEDVQHSELVEEVDYGDVTDMPSLQVETAIALGGRVVSSGVSEMQDQYHVAKQSDGSDR